jgi:hypothetical protein
MPKLFYDPTYVLECLGALPEINDDCDYSIGAIYRTEHDGLVLALAFWQYEGCVEVTLHRSDDASTALVKLALFVVGEIKRQSEEKVDGTWFDALYFFQCHLSGDRFERYFEEPEPTLCVRISAYPKIQIEFV